jgi:gluconokinase
MIATASGTQLDSVDAANAETPISIALDIGSSSVRAMAFDCRGRAIAGTTSQQFYDLTTRFEGEVTIDADDALKLASQCLDQTHQAISEHPVPIGAIGISSFWHSLLGLDSHGTPVTPVYHLADNRSADVVDELRHSLDESAWQRSTGTVFHSSYWPAKLLWLRKHAPDAFSSVKRWTSVADYISERFLGTTTTSLCMASGTGMCEVVSGVWSAALAEHSGISVESLPRIVDRHSASFSLPDASSRWPQFAAAPWFPALGDGACANVGSGAIDRSRIALTLGTTGAMRVLDRSPTGQPVTGYPSLWTYRLDADTVIHGAAITNGGIWVDFIREILLDTSGVLLDEAFALPAGAHGLTVLPFLAGERAPIWNDRARAVIAGLSPATSRSEIARASLEAIAHRLALIYQDVAPAADRDHHVIANGAALLRSSGLQQMVADDLEHPLVTLPASLEASARGAAICAMQSAGIIDSIADVDDFVHLSPSIIPDPNRSVIYRAERLRQEALRRLLYPGSTSWDDP